MYDYKETVAELDSVGIKTVFIFEPQKKKEDYVGSLLNQQAYPFLSVIVRNGGGVIDKSPSAILPATALLLAEQGEQCNRCGQSRAKQQSKGTDVEHREKLGRRMTLVKPISINWNIIWKDV